MNAIANSNGQRELSIADHCVIMFTNLQAGIGDLPLTVPEPELHAEVGALARLAKIFGIPVIVSTVPGSDGSAATIFPEIFAGAGERPILQRTTPNSMRESRNFTATLAPVFPVMERAGPRGVELGLRDSTEVFGVPSGSLGPAKSEKVDVSPLDVHKVLRRTTSGDDGEATRQVFRRPSRPAFVLRSCRR